MSRLFAAIYDPFMRKSEQACLQEWRHELLSGVRGGEVLEIGAGTGANLAHYSSAIDRLVLADPDEHMLQRLRDRAEAGLGGVKGPRWETMIASVERLPFEDASFDTVVATLLLCSVPDQRAALSEVRRVLRPGGSFVFLEHVASETDPDRLRWQQRLEPFWKLIAGNCHLTRRTAETIESLFEVEEIERDTMRKALPFIRPTIRGRARKRGA